MSADTYQLREQRDAAALRLKVRGVARRLGVEVIDAGGLQTWITLALAPTVHLHARRSWQNKDMIQWSAHSPLAQGNSRPGICTAIARPCSALAADVQRRLIPAARAWCRAVAESAAHEKDRAQAQRAKLAELEQALGPMRETHDDAFATDGFSIRRGELRPSDYGNRYEARISVRSWHCLLMIGKLIAEDGRVAKASAPPPNADE